MPNTIQSIFPSIYAALDTVSRELIGKIPAVAPGQPKNWLKPPNGAFVNKTYDYRGKPIASAHYVDNKRQTLALTVIVGWRAEEVGVQRAMFDENFDESDLLDRSVDLSEPVWVEPLMVSFRSMREDQPWGVKKELVNFNVGLELDRIGPPPVTKEEAMRLTKRSFYYQLECKDPWHHEEHIKIIGKQTTVRACGCKPFPQYEIPLELQIDEWFDKIK